MKGTRFLLLTVIGFVLVSLSFGPSVGFAAHPQHSPHHEVPNSESALVCSDSEASNVGISQASIHVDDETITTNEPARVSGQVSAPKSNPCGVTVQMVMTIPSGMYVAGTNDVSSGGPGQLTSSFDLSPGETVSMSANVYGSDVGSELVMVDFRYFPAGYPDKYNQLSGFSLGIEVVEPNPRGPPPGVETKTASSPTPSPDDGGQPLRIAAIGLVGALLLLLLLK